MDPMDHEADSGHNDDHNPGRAYQVADNWTPPRPANDNNDRGIATIVSRIARGAKPDLSNVIANIKFK